MAFRERNTDAPRVYPAPARASARLCPRLLAACAGGMGRGLLWVDGMAVTALRALGRCYLEGLAAHALSHCRPTHEPPSDAAGLGARDAEPPADPASKPLIGPVEACGQTQRGWWRGEE